MRWWHRLLEAPLALLLLFEEWGWEALQQGLARLARWPPMARLERRIEALPPWAAMTVFGVPALTLLPLKLAALWLVGRGHPWLALWLVIAAKGVGTAVVARLFTLTRPALLQVAWFAVFYPRWVAWKAALFSRLRASWVWRAAARIRRRLGRHRGGRR